MLPCLNFTEQRSAKKPWILHTEEADQLRQAALHLYLASRDGWWEVADGTTPPPHTLLTKNCTLSSQLLNRGPHLLYFTWKSKFRALDQFRKAVQPICVARGWAIQTMRTVHWFLSKSLLVSCNLYLHASFKVTRRLISYQIYHYLDFLK